MEEGYPHFLPLDLLFNRRSIRENMDEVVHLTTDMNRKRNARLSSLYPLSWSSSDSDRPLCLGISDQYLAGLRIGTITSHLSRLDRIDHDGTLRLSSGEQIQRPDVIMLCTGYTTLLPFLPPSLQHAISYRMDDQYVPILTDNLVLHPDLPNAGFVGVYRGPYFAVIELQARYLASLFAGKIEWPSADDMKRGLALEASLRETDKDRRMQFPHGDYGGLVETYARLLGIPSPSPHTLDLQDRISDSAVGDFALAVNYPLIRTPDVQAIESDLLETLQYSSRGGWVLTTVFHSWCGSWKVRRIICDHTSNGMDGTFEGVADFYPRPPSALPEDDAKLHSSQTLCSPKHQKGSDRCSDGNGDPERGVLEYVYHEHGTFTTSTGITFQAHRKYIYRYQPTIDTVSAWFCKGPASTNAPHCGEIDYWFHDIVIDAPAAPGDIIDRDTDRHGAWFKQHRQKGGWLGSGTEHLCIRDVYRPVYKFCFGGAELREFGIGYDVEGPAKRYVSEAWYERA